MKQPSKREVDISPEQISRLIDALPESLGKIVEFAVYTGFRKDNVLSLKTDQVLIHDILPKAQAKWFCWLKVAGGKRSP